ncbi:hypothetical protein ABW19_dt0203977 [Dactylella cylindrospora]|nr:hypothetical protein ABW19_dt0203977 [Dactylella cylindrospora]
MQFTTVHLSPETSEESLPLPPTAPPPVYRPIGPGGPTYKYIKFHKRSMKTKTKGNPIISMDDVTREQIKEITSQMAESRNVKTILDFLPHGFYPIEFVKRQLNSQEIINGTKFEWGLLDLYCHYYPDAIGVVFVKMEASRTRYSLMSYEIGYGQGPMGGEGRKTGVIGKAVKSFVRACTRRSRVSDGGT